MRFRVLLEIEAPEIGTKMTGGGILSSPEDWVWQDFFGVTVVEAIIIKPGFCGNCEKNVAFFDYLCGDCRESATPGQAQWKP